MNDGALLILGAQGFIGQALRRLLAPQRRLVNVDRVEADPPAAPSERNLRLDLSEREQIDQLFETLGDEADAVEGVIDLVAYYDFENRPDPRYRAVEEGLEHLLRRGKEHLRPDVPFIYASSMAALEPTEPGRKLTADSPRSDAWAYTAHKVRCERILEAADVPQPRVELVLAGVYSDWCELVPLYQQIERVRRASVERLFYPGPIDRGFPYLHVDDAARAFEAAVEACRGRPGVHRYMVGEEEPVTYRMVQDIAAETFLGRSESVMRVPRAVARGGARVLDRWARWRGRRTFIQPWMIDYAGEHFELDIGPTIEDLGWRPTHDLHGELADICARAREHEDEWRRRNDARPF